MPLHWLAARDASPAGTAGWAFVAAASLGEVSWMVAHVLLETEVAPALIALGAFVATGAAFFRRDLAVPA